MTPITEHFTVEEMTASQTAARNGLDNTPGDAQLANLKTLCEQILEPARAALGPLHIDSGYRSPEVNHAVGGSKTSAHMLGYAADVIPQTCGKLDFARWVAANVDFDQIILEFGTPDDPAWIHVSCDPRGRKQIIKTVHGGGYAPAEL